MAQKTSKTLELRIKSIHDGDKVLDIATKQVSDLGVEVVGLTSVYKENAKEGLKWLHTFRLVAKDVQSLEKTQARLGASSVGNLDPSTKITQNPLNQKINKDLLERLRLYKELKAEQKRVARAQLDEAKRTLKEEERAKKETINRIVAARRQQEAQMRQLIAEKEARVGINSKRNRELLAANEKTIRLEKLIISKGANDIVVIRERLAQEEKRIQEQLQKDLAEIARKRAEGELKNISAARTKVFAQYRKDILATHKELDRANKADKVAKEQQLQINKEITHSIREQERAQQQVVNGVRSAVRAHRHWSVMVAEGIGLYRVMSFVITSVSNAVKSIPRVGIELQTTQAVLEATLGSASAAKGAFTALDKEAERTGISITILRENFRNLNASMTLAGETSKTAWKVFTDLNTVSTALHMSGDKTQLTFLAIAQIFNKSKVQSEELVKQLGNLLPGAFASFQQANSDMFASTQDLVKAMSDGTVFAHNLVAKFIEEYANKFRPAFAAASVGMQATIGRTQTSFVHLGEAIFNTTKGPMTDFLKLIVSGTNLLTKFIEQTDVLAYILKGVLVIGITLLSKKIFSLIKPLFEASKNLGFFSGGIKKVKGVAALGINIINGLKTALHFFLKTPGGWVATVSILAEGFASIGREARLATEHVNEYLAAKKQLGEKPKPITLETRLTDNKEIKKFKKDIASSRRELAFKSTTAYQTVSQLLLGKTPSQLDRELNVLKRNIKVARQAITDITKSETLKQAQFEKEQAARQDELEQSIYGKGLKKQEEREVRTTKALDKLRELQGQEQLIILTKNLQKNEEALTTFYSKRKTLTVQDQKQEQTLLKNREDSIKEFYNKKKEIELQALRDKANTTLLGTGKLRGNIKTPEERLAELRQLQLEAKQMEVAIEKEKQQALEQLRNEQKRKRKQTDAEEKRLARERKQFNEAAIKTEINLLAIQGKVAEASKEEIKFIRDKSIAAIKGNSVRAKLAKQQIKDIATIKLHNLALVKLKKDSAKLDKESEDTISKIQSLQQNGALSEIGAMTAIRKVREEQILLQKQVVDGIQSEIDKLKEKGGLESQALQEALALQQAKLTGLQQQQQQPQSTGIGFAQKYLDSGQATGQGITAALGIGNILTKQQGIKEKIIADKKDQLAIIDTLTFESAKNREETVARIEGQAKQASFKNTVSSYKGIFALGSSTFKGLSEASAKMYGAQSKQARAAFAQYKALKIAEAAIATAGAIIGFLQNPGGYPGIALAVLAAAMGAVQVAQISAQQPPAAHGGLTTVPKEQTYLLDKGERVVSPNQNRDLTAFLNNNTLSQPQAQPNIRIINAVDPGLFTEYLGSDEGEKVVMNIVRRNQ